MKVIISGGGTAGSVMPLVAIATEIIKQHPDSTILFIGTKKGHPEKTIIADYNFEYYGINCGKIRRYFDIKNITDIIRTLSGFIQSLVKINKFKPDIVIGAGGYVSVPVIWAAWVWRKKILIHQQDIKPSVSNILTMALADKITVTFEKSLQNFPASKTIWTGNPVRGNINDGNLERAYANFKLKKSLPIVLVIGGGTGSTNINFLINQALSELIKFCQIIHITGQGKHVTGIDSSNYQQYEFITQELKDLLAAADLIVSRAGLSALTEYSILGKPVILIPLPNSHQEANAQYYAEKNAAILLEERNISPTILAAKIREILSDKKGLSLLSEQISRMAKPDSTGLIIDQINKLVS